MLCILVNIKIWVMFHYETSGDLDLLTVDNQILLTWMYWTINMHRTNTHGKGLSKLSNISIFLQYLASFTAKITHGKKKNTHQPMENQNPFCKYQTKIRTNYKMRQNLKQLFVRNYRLIITALKNVVCLHNVSKEINVCIKNSAHFFSQHITLYYLPVERYLV